MKAEETNLVDSMKKVNQEAFEWLADNLSENPQYSPFYRIAHEIADTLAKKNHDYGDSFYKMYKKFGDRGTFMRLFDKMGRFETLIEGEAMIENEPLEDVLRDIAGYCILTLVSKQRLKQEES